MGAIAVPDLARSNSLDVTRFGADPTGVRESSGAINRALGEGGEIVIPAGRFRIDHPLKATVPDTKISGAGLLFSTPGLKQDVLLTLAADRITVAGPAFANPTESQAQTGDRNVGIGVFANGCQVLRSRFDRFQHSIMVSAHGEFFDTVIADNVLTNCIGAGDGPHNLFSNLGEDRGDGIVSWGARTTIVRNRVSAKRGTDARVGIHCEALRKFKELPSTPDDDRVAIIEGNIVRGSFRRGIAVEGVGQAIVRRNQLPGGYTWWGIAALQEADDIQIIDNDVVFDRAQSDHSGGRWNPLHAGIICAVYGPGSRGSRELVAGNKVSVTRGGGAGIYALNAGRPGALAHVTIERNQVSAASLTAHPGVAARGVSFWAARDNIVTGPFQQAVKDYDRH